MLIRALLFSGIGLLSACQQPGMDFNFDTALSIAQKAQQATQTIEEPEEISMGSGIAANLLGASPSRSEAMPRRAPFCNAAR